VLVAKANKWSLLRLIGVVVLVGSCHVAITIGLGLAALGAKDMVDHEHGLEHVSAAVLFGLGLLYVILHFAGGGHHHEKDQVIAEKISIISLLISMTISPCVMIIPMFLMIAPQAPAFLILVSLVLLITTVGTMMILVTLSYLGIERLKFHFIDRYEKLIIGITLCILSLVTYLIMSGHKH
jgi:hypothetical protein